jgi:hypothetical protein
MLGQGTGMSYGAQNLQGLLATPIPQIPQPVVQPIQPSVGMSQPVMDVQYVNDEQSAINYQMAPNKVAILLKNDDDVFYFKQTDASGSYSLKRYRFYEEDEESVADNKYATKEDLSSLEDKITKLTETIEKKNNKPSKNQNKR